MSPSNAYTLLQRLSPEALDAIERMISQGFSPANIARLLSRQYRRDVSRLILPAALRAKEMQS